MTGIAIVVWCTDGRLKFQLHHHQEELAAHIERLKESVSPAMWNVYMVGHEQGHSLELTFEAIKGDDSLDH